MITLADIGHDTITLQTRLLTAFRALGDAGHAHGLDEIVDGAGGDALDVGHLDDGGEGLLGGAAWLKNGWKVRAFSELWGLEIDASGPRLPGTVAHAGIA